MEKTAHSNKQLLTILNIRQKKRINELNKYAEQTNAVTLSAIG